MNEKIYLKEMDQFLQDQLYVLITIWWDCTLNGLLKK